MVVSHWAMNTFAKLCCAAALCLGVAACSDDNDSYLPPYVTTLGEIQTDASGQPVFFTPDKGEQRRIATRHTGFAADTLYRVQALAVYEDDGSVSLRQLVKIISPYPRSVAEAARKYAPVDVLSLWSSGRYINMRIALHTATEPHAFTFVDEGIETLPNGIQRLRLHLYHDRGANPEYYTRETYLSCPIYQYKDPTINTDKTLEVGRDSILFSITTYEGEQTLHILYE